MALSLAANEPAKAYELLSAHQSLEPQALIKIIDRSVTADHKKAHLALLQLKIENSDRYLAYFFYRLSEKSPRTALAVLRKMTRD